MNKLRAMNVQNFVNEAPSYELLEVELKANKVENVASTTDKVDD